MNTLITDLLLVRVKVYACVHSINHHGMTSPCNATTHVHCNAFIITVYWLAGNHNCRQIAAMASAAYDGHEQSMGAGVGAKNADKGFKVILAAVTGTGRRNLDYMRMISLWGKAFRKDQRFPADVLNFHGYGASDVRVPPPTISVAIMQPTSFVSVCNSYDSQCCRD